MFSLRKFVLLAIVFFCASFQTVMAEPENILNKERTNVVKRYVQYLGHNDTRSIQSLFTDRAVAVASNGDTDTVNHFYETTFKKTFSSPGTKLINVFEGRLKDNMMTAYYNLSWVNASGEVESAKFIDLFIFQAESSKIKTIYVFSNSFREDVVNG